MSEDKAFKLFENLIRLEDLDKVESYDELLLLEKYITRKDLRTKIEQLLKTKKTH